MFAVFLMHHDDADRNKNDRNSDERSEIEMLAKEKNSKNYCCHRLKGTKD